MSYTLFYKNPGSKAPNPEKTKLAGVGVHVVRGKEAGFLMPASVQHGSEPILNHGGCRGSPPGQRMEEALKCFSFCFLNLQP